MEIPAPAVLFPERMWSGKQLFSMLLINEVNIYRGGKSGPSSPDDTRVVIRQGHVHQGVMSKAMLGSKAGGLVHVLYNKGLSKMDEGRKQCRRFLNGCQRLVNAWLMMRGFSIGIQDTLATRTINDRIIEVIDDAKTAADAIIDTARQGSITLSPGETMQDAFESSINQRLNKAIDECGTMVMSSIRRDNAIYTMIEAGSKGSKLNMSQIVTCVGQQNVNGKRIPDRFWSGRTLPHFAAFDYGPLSRGFVANGYLKGLSPAEFFFHAMGGREGLVDTAVKTAQTGYIYRRLVKALEDLCVRYDGTVRNAQGHLVSGLYGEDGLNAQRMESQRFISLKASNQQFRSMFLHSEGQQSTLPLSPQ
ncbi:hypothetical protein KIPB_011135, partial [Kipferlia bialata]|eukprot:g11135.t1